MLYVLITAFFAQSALPPPGHRAELDHLCGRGIEFLRRPVPYRFPHDHARERFMHALRLAAVWPRPEFREPLMAILESNNRPMIAFAAAGLLNYGDAETNARVLQMTEDRREYALGCIGHRVGTQVAEAIKRHALNWDFADSPQELLPASRVFLLSLEIPGYMTVPRAMVHAQAQNLSVRFQAYYWLEYQGIVLDPQPLLDAWPRLDATARQTILGYGDRIPLLGAERLRDALELILANEEWTSPVTRARLVCRLAALGSDRAHEAALALIRELPRGTAPDSTRPLDPWTFALRGLIQVSRSSDVQLANAWIRESNDVLALGGYGLLAAQSDPYAVRTVIEYLNDASRMKDSFFFLDPVDILQSREWRDDSVRWQYIRAIQDILNRPTDPNRVFRKCGYLTSTLIDTANALTQVFHGENGLIIPSGFDEAEVAATIERFNSWVDENDPGRYNMPD